MDPVDGTWAMTPVNALHIWPRHEYMLIALPNPGGSWTCTLFAPFRTFERLDASDDETVAEFFRTNFGDAAALMPDFLAQYRTHPTGALIRLKIKPWNYMDKVVVMGDAAHAIVPFFGQVRRLACRRCCCRWRAGAWSVCVCGVARR
jgi:kynurenine 3-monooxygenase